MDSTKYQKITISRGMYHFSLYCTDDSFHNRREQLTRWADSLARRLHWRTYNMTFSRASRADANKNLHALFEHRFPD